MLRLSACALGCALIVAAASVAAPVPEHLMKQPVYYFPTKIGTKLVYAEPGSETERTLVVTAVSERAGAKVVSVARLNHDDSVTPQMTMAVTGCGPIGALATVLATGGGAALWERSTNPRGAIGAGAILAHGAGAELADLELC